jgi:hypothetical protein
MVDVINLDDITYEQFVNDYLYLNKPCLIKNFTNNFCNINTIDKYTKNKDIQTKYKIGNINVYSNTYEEICNNFIIESIKNDENILLNKKSIRVWKHNKNNLTKWHYDGNGVDIFNISIQGSKEFYLSKPGSIGVYPLSNIIITNNDYMIRCLLYGFYETLPFFILFYIVFLKYNKIKYILLIAGLYLILNKELAIHTSGISELYGIFFILYYLIIEHISKLILKM